MSGLSHTKLEDVRTLIETMSDVAVRRLESALAGAVHGPQSRSLVGVLDLVATESAERSAAGLMLGPLLPLFQPPSGDVRRLTYAPGLQRLFWRGVKASFPREMEEAYAAAGRMRPEDAVPPIFDHLCQASAEAVLDGSLCFGEVTDALRLIGGPEPARFASLLKLVPVSRRALAHVPDWVGKATSERLASARLVFRDAGHVCDDAGPLLFEILLAHMDEPWLILRVIASVMANPSDRFLAETELADFGRRLLDGLDERIGRVRRFNASGGAEAGRQAGEDICAAAAVVQEFETAIDLRRDGPWGGRVADQKRTLAVVVEQRLKEVEPAILAALPLQPARFAVRMLRGVPKLMNDPDPGASQRARGLVAFLAATRATAAYGGFGALRTKVLNRVQERLEQYVEDLIEVLHEGDPEHEPKARQFLELAAELTALAGDEKGADLVRRRAAVAAAAQEACSAA